MEERLRKLLANGWSVYNNDTPLMTRVSHPKHGGPMFIADAYRKLGWAWYDNGASDWSGATVSVVGGDFDGARGKVT